MSVCITTANTKALLIERVEFEASALDSAYTRIADETRKALDAGDMEAVAKAAKDMNAIAGVKARVANVLDDTPREDGSEGTRNAAGAVVKAVMKASGRNMLAEGREALGIIERLAGAGIDLHDAATVSGIVESFGSEG